MAFNFVSASTQNVGYGDQAGYDNFGATFSVSVWGMATTWNQTGGFVAKRDAFQSNESWGFYVAGTSSYLTVGTGTTPTMYYTCSNAAWPLNRWIHLLATYNSANAAGSRIKMYVNGVSQSMSVGVEGTTSQGAGTAPLKVGQVNSGASPFYFNGQLAEPAVFKTELTAADALRLASGMRADEARPRTELAFYDPMRDSPCWDEIQGVAGVITGAMPFEHPFIDEAVNDYLFGVTAAAGVFQPGLMMMGVG